MRFNLKLSGQCILRHLLSFQSSESDKVFRSIGHSDIIRNSRGWVLLEVSAFLSLFFILITMVISLAPLYNIKSQLQRDLDNATRAAAIQLDMQELHLGQIVFNEDILEVVFDEHLEQYNIRDRSIEFDTTNKVVTSTISVVVVYKPWFIGREIVLIIPRTSSVQVFIDE